MYYIRNNINELYRCHVIYTIPGGEVIILPLLPQTRQQYRSPNRPKWKKERAIHSNYFLIFIKSKKIISLKFTKIIFLHFSCFYNIWWVWWYIYIYMGVRGAKVIYHNRLYTKRMFFFFLKFSLKKLEIKKYWMF